MRLVLLSFAARPVKRTGLANISPPVGFESRAGFSVLEAVVVLAITSLALVLVFSIGSKASQTGFRLGRRALGIADSQLEAENLRAIIGGLVVPPPFSGQTTFGDFEGAPDSLSADATLARPTLCADAGPAGHLALQLIARSGDTALSCKTAGGAATTLADFHGARVRFSYSVDGQTWSDTLRIAGQADPSAPLDPKMRLAQERRVWVRLASDDNGFQLVEMLSSGLPPPPPPGSDVF